MKTHTFTIPAFGQFWPEQGGHLAGIMQHSDGRLYALIVPPKGQGELDKHEWNEYRQKIKGADSLTDGAANTQALIAAGLPLGKPMQGFEHAGHDDWYIPARAEMLLAHGNCKDQFEDGEYYWTSSQCSAGHAWYQSFDDGSSNWFNKRNSLRVRPVRRLFL